MNYYELLEISPSASIEVIRNAYKTLAKKYHPDTYCGDTAFAEEKMKLLNEAVSVLEDEIKRNEYNKINGINSPPHSGYPENSRADMINFDENGEPIFFSYDSDGSDGSAGDDSYMDIIDDFINESRKYDKKTEKKPDKTGKKKENAIIPDEIIADIAANISEINAKKFGTENENQDYSGEDGEDENEKEEIKTKTKSYSERIKLYYIVLAAFGVAIVVLAVLIIRNVNFDNIRELFLNFSEGDKSGENTASDEYSFNMTEEASFPLAQLPVPIETAEPLIEETTEETIEETIEETTEETAEETAEITTPAKVLPTDPPTTPPAPATEPAPEPETAAEQTEEQTAEQTEEQTTEQTEEQTAEQTEEQTTGEQAEEITGDPEIPAETEESGED